MVADTVIFKMSIDPLRYYHKLEEDGISNYTLSQLNDSTYLYMDKVAIEIPQKFLEFSGRRKIMKLVLEETLNLLMQKGLD